MKKLIISCDGTWNTQDEKDHDIPTPTNVVRLHNCIAATDARGAAQLKYYHPGVGTEGSLLKRIAGGAFGLGIDQNIMGAYRWLAANYADGDEIYVFGFSRGAYTARSLCGFIGAAGLADLSHCQDDGDCWKRVQTAYTTIYRVPAAQRPAVTWPSFKPNPATGKLHIRFLGVWDTVGSLGIPDDLALLNLLDRSQRWAFHDTTLGTNIDMARHAVAIDEMRASFTPTFWTLADGETVLNDPDDTGRVRQLWFPGVHSDIGGGYTDTRLSDVALKWMIEQAERAGLTFEPRMVNQIEILPHGLLHDSLSGAFKTLRTRPRNRPTMFDRSIDYHGSAIARDQDPPLTQSPYHHPMDRLAPGQVSEALPIYARNHWNETGIFLEAGATYEFSAQGEWLDATVACGPDGSRDGHFGFGEIGHLAGSLLGSLEHAYEKVTGNNEADFIGSRRAEAYPWFSLVGVIANDGPEKGRNPNPDGSPYAHQTFLIGKGPTPLTIKPTEAGYLYAFANDAWHFYGNNRGSVSLTVKRIS